MKKKTRLERDVTPKPKSLVMGRPSKYKPEFCQMLIDHMSEGYSFETFAIKAKVNQDTLHEWAKVHPDFSEAKKEAFLHAQSFWEKQGIDGLFVPKGVSFSASTWIFNMKCRFKWRDGDEDKHKPQEQTKKVYKVKWADEDDGTNNIGNETPDTAAEENK